MIFINSFNAAGVAQDPVWSLNNWRSAFSDPSIWTALRNTLMVYVLYTAISFPVAVAIAWALARTNVVLGKWFSGE